MIDVEIIYVDFIVLGRIGRRNVIYDILVFFVSGNSNELVLKLVGFDINKIGELFDIFFLWIWNYL